MSGEQICLQAVPKLLSVNSCISQMIRQWILECWCGDRKCTFMELMGFWLMSVVSHYVHVTGGFLTDVSSVSLCACDRWVSDWCWIAVWCWEGVVAVFVRLSVWTFSLTAAARLGVLHQVFLHVRAVPHRHCFVGRHCWSVCQGFWHCEPTMLRMCRPLTVGLTK